MRILYVQPGQSETSVLSRFGVQNCYFKELSINRDCSSITQKRHHHTGFELHIVIDGYQEYEIEGKTYKLKSGCFLLIYPNAKHKVINSTPNTHKYSITFNKQIDKNPNCFFGKLSDRMSDNIAFIINEASLKKEISLVLLENSILEILVLTFRLSGIKENDNPFKQDENTTITLAKQYINDNIEFAPSVTDVSEYCYLSTRQFTRIFQSFEGISPGEYIINMRTKRIENMLVDKTLSLKQISLIMNFDNEYYFNTFFKKHSGMPPGEYRKMLGK